MNNLKKLIAGASVAALMSVAVGAQAAVVSTNNGIDGIGRTDNISQWIVLDGLFGGVNGFGTNAVVGPNGAIIDRGIDPIGQWIVLDSLFGGAGAFGNTNAVVGPNGAIVNRGIDPIGQWIVLDALFGGVGGFGSNAVVGQNGAVITN